MDRGDPRRVDEFAFHAVANIAAPPRPAAVRRAIELCRARAGEDNIGIVGRLADLENVQPVHRRRQMLPAVARHRPVVDADIGARQHVARPRRMGRDAPGAGFVVDAAGRREGAVPALAQVVAEPDRMADRRGIDGDVHAASRTARRRGCTIISRLPDKSSSLRLRGPLSGGRAFRDLRIAIGAVSSVCRHPGRGVRDSRSATAPSVHNPGSVDTSMKSGDSMRTELFDYAGNTVLGVIEQTVERSHRRPR